MVERFTCPILFNIDKSLTWFSIMLILWIKKLSLTKVKWLYQSCLANKWENLDWDPDLLDSNPSTISSSSLTMCFLTSFKISFGYRDGRIDSGNKKENEKHGKHRLLREIEGMREVWETDYCEQREERFAWNKSRTEEETSKYRHFN